MSIRGGSGMLAPALTGVGRAGRSPRSDGLEPGGKKCAAMRRARLIFLPLLLLTVTVTSSAKDVPPGAWKVVHSETLFFEQGQVPALLTWADGLQARRFHLRIEGARSFDAKLVRARDGTILYGGRRAARHSAVIPWGRDEVAHLTIDSRWRDGVQVVVELAVDPNEEGLAVYSFEVNRFLRFYEAGKMERAKEALAFALAEDPTDSLAAGLWTRLWKSEGLTVPPAVVGDEEEEQDRWLAIAEGQRLERLEREVGKALAAAGSDSALARLELAAPFRTRRARRDFQVLVARNAAEVGQDSRATLALYQALDVSQGFEERGEVYRLLVEANLRLENEAQARAIQQRALGEAPDPSARRWVERWIPRQP